MMENSTEISIGASTKLYKQITCQIHKQSYQRFLKNNQKLKQKIMIKLEKKEIKFKLKFQNDMIEANNNIIKNGQ